MNDLLMDAATRAALPRRPRRAASRPPGPDALTDLAELGGPLPDQSRPPAKALARLDRLGSPATVACAGPHYFGFVTGGPLPATVAANWLAAAWDRNAFSAVNSPLGAAVEKIALGWVIEALGMSTDDVRAAPSGGDLSCCYTRPCRVKLQGMSSLRRVILWSAMRASTAVSQACGSTPLSFAGSIKV